MATISGYYLLMGVGFLVAGLYTSAVDVRRSVFAYAILVWILQVCAAPHSTAPHRCCTVARPRVRCTALSRRALLYCTALRWVLVGGGRRAA